MRAVSRGGFIGLGLAAFMSCSACQRRRPAYEIPSSLHFRYAVLACRLHDAETAYRFHQNADIPLPAASLVKLLIAVAAAEAVRTAVVAFEDKVAVAPAVAALASSAMWDVEPSRQFTIRELLDAMLSVSDNFAANALIARLGIDAINEVASRLRLRVTRIHGYFFDSIHAIRPKVFTTARDMLSILKRIVTGAHEPNTEVREIYRQIVDSMERQDDRRIIPSALPPSLVVADKTGEIRNALSDVAILDPFSDDPVFVLVLADHLAPLNTPLYAVEVEALRRLSREAYERCI
jgi:beta-lactamase class A